MAGLLFCGEILAIAPDYAPDRYKSIPEQNAFRLKSPPQIEPPGPTNAPLAKLILTGITTILDTKRALLKALPSVNAPGQQPKEESMILTEGQREGNIEVLNIDEVAGSVRVNNSGTIMTLTFEKDGAKLQSPPPLPPGAPGLPSALSSNPAPTMTVPTRTPGGAPRPKPMFPTRNIRTSEAIGPNQAGQNQAQAEQNQATAAAQNQATAAASSVAEPRVVPSSPPVPAPAPVPAVTPADDLTPEERAVIQALQSGSVPGTISPTQGTPPILPQ